jgi:hypothetical protein
MSQIINLPMGYNIHMPTPEEFEENARVLREVRPWDLLNPNKERVDEEEKNRRLAICETCPMFRKKSRTCQRCGCFMNLKTLLAEAHCPDHLW